MALRASDRRSNITSAVPVDTNKVIV